MVVVGVVVVMVVGGVGAAVVVIIVGVDGVVDVGGNGCWLYWRCWWSLLC